MTTVLRGRGIKCDSRIPFFKKTLVDLVVDDDVFIKVGDGEETGSEGKQGPSIPVLVPTMFSLSANPQICIIATSAPTPRRLKKITQAW